MPPQLNRTRRTTRFGCIFAGLALVASGLVASPAASVVEETLPLITFDDFDYVGAFALPADEFGQSSLNFSEGPIDVDGDSLYIVGHNHQQAIAEFTIPELVDSTNIADLNTATPPAQNFAAVLDRVPVNDQNINRIGGLEYHDGQLIVNGYEYYDAAADNTDTTLVIRDADQLATSKVDGYFQLDGAARASGWISEVPEYWQDALGGTHLVGHSSGIPINGRSSIGPSAYALDADDIVGASSSDPALSSSTLLEFSLDNRLHDDLSNADLDNDLWTHLSSAAFGFIVPGSRTYVTVGASGGHESGIGYKITQDDGNLCGGYCSYEAADVVNQYWLWDLDDLLDVRAGSIAAHSVRPYAYGEFPQPFQAGSYLNPIGGGSFDATTGTLYLSLQGANNTVGTYSNPPIIVAYQFPNIDGSSVPAPSPTETGCEGYTDSIARLYTAAFGREPERDGFRFWFREYLAGSWSLPQMATFFAGSDEFTGTYGSLDEEGFVRQLYRNVLRREGDLIGIDFWTAELNGGMTRGMLLLRFAESPENITNSGTTPPILGPYNAGRSGPFSCL